ncbi:MAG: HPr family phosphocarrier protein, partial [Coprococcus sp.]
VNCVGGLDARPIAMLVQKASQFESNVYIEILEQKKINAKSIMGMMSLNISDGEAVTVVTDGKDEQEAASAIEEYLSKQ